MQQQAIVQLAAAQALILLLFLSANLQTAECLSASSDAAAVGECNATRIGDCLAAGEEFLMESETNRRILQAGNGGNTITYPVASNPSRPYCDGNAYGSCIGEESKNYNDRPCNHQNTCDRPGS